MWSNLRCHILRNMSMFFQFSFFFPLPNTQEEFTENALKLIGYNSNQKELTST